MANDYSEAVNAHYGADDLVKRIQDALQAAGKDMANLTPADLAPFDQLHTGGPKATLELAQLARVNAADDVLDVGGGMGGPARMLADTFGCAVTVLDLTAEFIRTGATLTQWVGLSQQVKFQQGSAFSMPFGDQEFDLAWTQHSSMNMPDKPALYREIARVLKPGGRLALHEIIAGAKPPVYYPMPWADNANISFQLNEHDFRAVIAAAGLETELWQDDTATSLAWLDERRSRMRQEETPALSIQLVLGAGLADQFVNLGRSLREGRMKVIKAVFRRD